METLAPTEFASPETEPELNLLLERDRRGDWGRWRAAAIVSAAFHLVLLTVLLLVPESEIRVYELPEPTLHVTPLYIPTDLTQKAPNKGKLSKELTVEASTPRPAIKPPTPAPAAKFVLPPPPPPAAQTAKAEPKPVIVEPPKIEPPKAVVDNQADQLAKLNQPLPPPTQQPKLVLENLASPPPPAGANQGKPLGGVAIPNPSVASALHDLATSTSNGVPNGRVIVGDNVAELGGPALNLPPTAARLPANIELRSDPMGVDFRPYIQQILVAIKRNWLAVYPEAARLGQRGQVVLDFAIAKQGLVAKVVYTDQSGTKALDEAAVAAISASNPLPPLPKEFRGDRIVLRMTFMYNVKR